MKTSARIKTSVGIVIFFLIILLISITSYLKGLSNRTSAILKENHNSVVYARDMSNALNNLNQEIIKNYLSNKNPDSSLINSEISLFDKSLHLEKNNLTEPGEDKLASGIEKDYKEFRDSLIITVKLPRSIDKILYLQKKFDGTYKQLVLLSQLNERAIQVKTEGAKVSAENALIQMGILGLVCFIIALIFTYNLSSYFNQRFYQLYNGIKEIVASNYGQRLHFEGKDEFYEISLVFNEMAEELSENNKEISVNLHENSEKDQYFEDIQELRRILKLMKGIEEKAHLLISKIEGDK